MLDLISNACGHYSVVCVYSLDKLSIVADWLAATKLLGSVCTTVTLLEVDHAAHKASV